MSWFKRTATLFLCLLLAGCGFRPLYGNHAGGTASEAFLRVEIGTIRDRIGQSLRNELIQRLYGGQRRLAPEFRLVTNLAEQKTSLAVKKSAFATRGNLVVTADYRLVRLNDGGKVFGSSSRATVSYNILDSEFSTLLAEDNARKRAVKELSEDIRVRLGVYFDQVGSDRS